MPHIQSITLRQLRAFIVVAETMRFVAAAERLHLSQSALSTLIRELEEALGAKLFDRNTRMVQLTDIGRGFLPVATKMLADLDHAAMQVHELIELKRGRVTVACATLLASVVMPELIDLYHKEKPGIKVVVLDVPEEDIRDRVRAGEADLGMGTTLLPERELDERVIVQDDYGVIFPSGHRLEAAKEVRWRELAEESWAMLRVGSPTRTVVDGVAGGLDRPWIVQVEASYITTLLGMVGAGLGISAIPLLLYRLADPEKVHWRALVSPRRTRQIVIFSRAGQELSPAALHFSDFAAAVVPKSSLMKRA